ncbi:hypothetical protein NM208_g5820 [Fusarium decemcellulare]|uniref:Uncharacterized protein n=1 Tax=Fusarium decemcellulare TaxID=57161 RepID=A0ACC1SFG4_9HYPO|nr:hypothetical protein NM208_g5820 [Fusarium decemcellulare]
MEYFHILEHYRLIVCQICRYAVTPERVATHLRQAPHQLTWEEAQQASSWASSLDLANRIQPGDGSIPPVPDTSLPLTHLGPPRSGGYRCTANEGTCRYVASSIRRIREHGRHAHGFNSNSRGGRPRKKHAIASPIGPSSCPGVDARYWRTGVLYQRFFPSGSYSGYFEVARGLDVGALDGFGSGTDAHVDERTDHSDSTAEAICHDETELIIYEDERGRPGLSIPVVEMEAETIGSIRTTQPRTEPDQ